jgi:hypothetical protein
VVKLRVQPPKNDILALTRIPVDISHSLAPHRLPVAPPFPIALTPAFFGIRRMLPIDNSKLTPMGNGRNALNKASRGSGPGPEPLSLPPSRSVNSKNMGPLGQCTNGVSQALAQGDSVCIQVAFRSLNSARDRCGCSYARASGQMPQDDFRGFWDGEPSAKRVFVRTRG